MLCEVLDTYMLVGVRGGGYLGKGVMLDQAGVVGVGGRRQGEGGGHGPRQKGEGVGSVGYAVEKHQCITNTVQFNRWLAMLSLEIPTIA